VNDVIELYNNLSFIAPSMTTYKLGCCLIKITGILFVMPVKWHSDFYSVVVA